MQTWQREQEESQILNCFCQTTKSLHLFLLLPSHSYVSKSLNLEKYLPCDKIEMCLARPDHRNFVPKLMGQEENYSCRAIHHLYAIPIKDDRMGH